MMRAMRLIIALAVAFSLSAPITACGKKGKLDAPDAENIEFPRKYPSR